MSLAVHRLHPHTLNLLTLTVAAVSSFLDVYLTRAHANQSPHTNFNNQNIQHALHINVSRLTENKDLHTVTFRKSNTITLNKYNVRVSCHKHGDNFIVTK